ncbi:MAG: M14 family metallocarboxypeptidase [Paraglaciecola sp.]|nr:M14 family metallocarboxypeptidase [Paraglaciecola sp.]
MQSQRHYPIGTPGKKWGEAEKKQWLSAQSIKRSYAADVLAEIEAMPPFFKTQQYGELEYAAATYPLIALTSSDWDDNKPIALITGGVHGYETSGVHGALRFAQTKALDFADDFNFIIVPCVSPWGYETINRWNPLAIDPNRSFYPDSPAPEAANLMSLVEDLNILVHIDLHETTDTDTSEFRPAFAARDAIEQHSWEIPDGFYTVGDSKNPCTGFQTAIIAAVEQVTHIAPSDAKGMIIGAPMEQKGVINYPLKQLGLCASVSNAEFTTTTEVYPDSPKTNPENCILAQVAAISGGLRFIIEQF